MHFCVTSSVHAVVGDGPIPVLLLRLAGPRYAPAAVLPAAAVAHCALGLWMHTYFRPILSDIQISNAVASTNAKLSELNGSESGLQRSRVWLRITQPNGVPLLLVLVALLLWLAIGRCGSACCTSRSKWRELCVRACTCVCVHVHVHACMRVLRRPTAHIPQAGRVLLQVKAPPS